MTAETTTSAAPKHQESEVYDRQIRLWGAEAQAKISKAKVLYIHLTGVSSEVLKNLVLAGVRPVLCDSRPYPDAIVSTPSFFVTHQDKKKLKYDTVAHAMQASVQELNPLLGKCDILEKSVEDITKDDLKEYSMVVASRIGMEQASRIARATVKTGGKFYLVDCFGWKGAAVIDLGPNHSYREEINKKLTDLKVVETYIPVEDIFKVPLAHLIQRRVDKVPPPAWVHYRAMLEYYERHNKTWPTLKDKNDLISTVCKEWISKTEPELLELESLQDNALTELASTALAEMSPMCAVLGGVIGNEVIKGISGKGEPANNVILLDGWEAKCRNILVQPKQET